MAISNKEDLTQINVGDLLKIDRTTIGQLIDCLEMKELIFRKRNPQDRRQNIVLLTDSGRELVETMWLKMLEVEKEVLNDLSGIQEKVILDIAQFIKEKNNG
ncbi:transcriptional regulator SlyA [Streptococcus sanguinis]|uniref:Transcriptional regulator SlyA n=1 Tax=Streptococcus sanguinis TaxID=1305 RepID=A0ABD7JMW7_STRSA|nr:transcriptional regulator SlyA [Streptococcus sanguinis]RSI26340.1 transcriptional regulator SlyA [Streptococcus sanguinis]RSI36746.1 transcriptional regulator SlyA [Streptococcus sanguinis]RSI39870.1 transcriptional regulator SlyA [Streptococcus sanguinis]